MSCLYKVLVGIKHTHTQMASMLPRWDGFPAWGVGLTVVRSGPPRGKNEMYQSARLASERAGKGSRQEWERGKTHIQAGTQRHAYERRSMPANVLTFRRIFFPCFSLFRPFTNPGKTFLMSAAILLTLCTTTREKVSTCCALIGY